MIYFVEENDYIESRECKWILIGPDGLDINALWHQYVKDNEIDMSEGWKRIQNDIVYKNFIDHLEQDHKLIAQPFTYVEIDVNVYGEFDD